MIWLLLILSCGPRDEHAGHEMLPDPGLPGVLEIEPGIGEALGIRTVPAREGTATIERRAPVEVTWDPLQTVRFTAQSGGQVRALHVPRLGEPVTRGESVAVLYEPTVLAAFAELLLARDLGEPWQGAAADRLVNLGVEPPEIRAVLASGRSSNTYVVRATASGVVVSRPVLEGAWLPAGGTLAVVADASALVAEMRVVAPDLEPGTPVTLRDPATYETWPSVVSSVLPTADAAGVEVRLVPGSRLPVGRPLVGEWEAWAGTGVWVPRTAVVDTGERRVVFVAVGPHRYQPRTVTLGVRTDDEVQIVSGLEPGELVVVSGTFLLDSETQIGAMGHAGHGS